MCLVRATGLTRSTDAVFYFEDGDVHDVCNGEMESMCERESTKEGGRLITNYLKSFIAANHADLARYVDRLCAVGAAGW